MCGKRGHISRDCRSPKAAELRAKGIIGSPGIKGFSGGWGTKGFKGGWDKGKGKGKYGGKGKGINELDWPDEPENENAGEIQAMGGGFQIASVDKFPKPQVCKPKPQKGKAKGKGTFKPKQTQHLNTFHQRPEWKPPGLSNKSLYFRADNE